MANKPKFILVMRHAEKPQDVLDPNLSASGKARAVRLETYIPQTFGPPDFILAAAISKHSARPYETVQPLSQTIGKPIDATIADQDYGFPANELVSDTKYTQKSVVVCWHHGNIPSLMHALGANDNDYPDPWDRNVFNLILKVEFSASGEVEVSKIEEPF
jgi:phosphohistidine phosphatase SixA